MGKVSALWQDEKQRALDEFRSGAESEEGARHRLRQLGLECDDTENELWAVKSELYESNPANDPCNYPENIR